MYDLIKRLFPICRSLTGDGVRESLQIIAEYIPLTIHSVPTGTNVFDWEVPREWNIRDAYVEDKNGTRIIDFKNNNLHVMGYSVPVDKWVDLPELQEHLYSLEELPNAIPYITSYYSENWGFCVEYQNRCAFKEGKYHVVIDSTLAAGELNYGELIIPGKSEKEIFLSTYICHPSMANNELSGPVMATALAKWLSETPRQYTYRIVLIPETIGSITYLSKNLDIMKNNIIAGFNITCVGDDGPYSYLMSRYGNTMADKVAKNVLHFSHPDFLTYSFLERGSDERQYCSPGVDLPVVTVMRSKYGTFPEYHTSLDNLDFVSGEGLGGTFKVYQDCIEMLEKNAVYKVTCLGEPQLGKRGLYPNVSTKASTATVEDMMNLIAYADGTNDLIDISNMINTPVSRLVPIVQNLVAEGLLAEIN